MLKIFPKDQQSNLGQGSPDSNSSFAIGPALPSGLSKIHTNPTVALGSIHCGIQRICGHIDRTSSTQWPAEKLGAVADHSPFLCPWLAFESGQSDAGILLALRQYPSWRNLANGNSATSDAVASSTKECSSPLMLLYCSFHCLFAKSTRSKKQSWADP